MRKCVKNRQLCHKHAHTHTHEVTWMAFASLGMRDTVRAVRWRCVGAARDLLPLLAAGCGLAHLNVSPIWFWETPVPAARTTKISGHKYVAREIEWTVLVASAITIGVGIKVELAAGFEMSSNVHTLKQSDIYTKAACIHKLQLHTGVALICPPG